MSVDQPTPEQQPGTTDPASGGSPAPEPTSDPTAAPAGAPATDPAAQPGQPGQTGDPADQVNPPAEPGGQPLTEAGERAQEVQDQADAQGYLGTNPDPRPNEAYSLETGPQSPSLLEQQLDEARAEVVRLEGLLDAERARGNSEEQVS